MSTKTLIMHKKLTFQHCLDLIKYLKHTPVTTNSCDGSVKLTSMAGNFSQTPISHQRFSKTTYSPAKIIKNQIK